MMSKEIKEAWMQGYLTGLLYAHKWFRDYPKQNPLLKLGGYQRIIAIYLGHIGRQRSEK